MREPNFEEPDFNHLVKLDRSKRPKRNRKKIIIMAAVAIVVVVLIVIGVGVRVHNDYNSALQRESPEIQREREQRDQEHHFIEHIAAPAITAYRKNYQVLPSIVIAQSIVESEWGSSALYRTANNPFGIKGSYHHHSVTYDTAEYVNSRKVTVKARFRKYPNLKAAIMDHDYALNRGFIHKNHVMSYVTDANLLQRNHYATDPKYASKLVKIIKLYHLGRYDLRALNG